MKISDLQPGDMIQRKGSDQWWLVEYVFPEKIVVKRTRDVLAPELEGWEKVPSYGRMVGSKYEPETGDR